MSIERKKNILIVFGTRPEAIKMAPLIKEFQKYPESFDLYICVTAQHRQMLDQVLNLFEITPDFDFNIMRDGQDLYDITARVLLGMREVIHKCKPHVVLVHGDTSTSAAAALAAYYQRVSVGHVEAGLRTYNIYSPWPEEINRQITSRIASKHFAPTDLSRQNLINEQVDPKNIYITGNTVIDALYKVVSIFNNNKAVEFNVIQQLELAGIKESTIKLWKSKERKLVLITGHRRENFGSGFENICNAIKKLSTKFSEVDFVYPVHLNPNVRNPILEVFGDDVFKKESTNSLKNVFFSEPLEYLPFVYLMSRSYLILTDSGGIQEEAPSLGIPVLVMRDTTERPEAITAGTVKLVGTSAENIVSEVSLLIDSPILYSNMTKANNPYGDGTASEKIVATFLKEGW